MPVTERIAPRRACRSWIQLHEAGTQSEIKKLRSAIGDFCFVVTLSSLVKDAELTICWDENGCSAITFGAQKQSSWKAPSRNTTARTTSTDDSGFLRTLESRLNWVSINTKTNTQNNVSNRSSPYKGFPKMAWFFQTFLNISCHWTTYNTIFLTIFLFSGQFKYIFILFCDKFPISWHLRVYAILSLALWTKCRFSFSYSDENVCRECHTGLLSIPFNLRKFAFALAHITVLLKNYANLAYWTTVIKACI